MSNFAIVFSVAVIATVIGVLILNKIDKIKITSDLFNQYIYFFILSLFTLLGIIIVFALISFSDTDLGNSYPLLIGSQLYLPFLLMIIGRISVKSSNFVADKFVGIRDVHLDKSDELTIYFVSIIGVSLISSILGFDIKYIFILITIWVGRFIWFDTSLLDIKNQGKDILKKFQNSRPVVRGALFCVVSFLISSILINVGETVELIKYISLGLYISMFSTGGIKLGIELRKIKKAKLNKNTLEEEIK